MRSLSPLPMKAFAHGGRNLHSNRIRQGGFKGGGAPLRGVRRTPATAFLQEYLEIVTAGENLERLPTALRLNTRYNRFLTTIIEAHTTCPRHEPRFFFQRKVTGILIIPGKAGQVIFEESHRNPRNPGHSWKIWADHFWGARRNPRNPRNPLL